MSEKRVKALSTRVTPHLMNVTPPSWYKTRLGKSEASSASCVGGSRCQQDDSSLYFPRLIKSPRSYNLEVVVHFGILHLEVISEGNRITCTRLQ